MRNELKTLMITLLVPMAAGAQDTVLNRNVTVEREFQPVIQSAGKIDQKPTTLETNIEPTSVQYSDFSAEMAPDFNLSSLPTQPTTFHQTEPMVGMLRGAIGHPLTLFDFTYRVEDKKKSMLDAYAHHNAQWGRKADARTTIGFDFTHLFSTYDLYFGVNGGNHHYTRYGRYYEGDNRLSIRSASELTGDDKVNIWDVEVYAGVKANKKQDLQYNVQVGYKLFHIASEATEHQIRTKASMEWTGSNHRGGLNFAMQNMFYSADTAQVPDSMIHSHHAFRIEPFYAYYGRRITLHLGVNLDMNIGRGKLLSGSNNVVFAPSPNIRFEAQLAPEWVTLYAKAEGQLDMCSLEQDMTVAPYCYVPAAVMSDHADMYVPIDGEAGFHLRPHKNLLMEVHAGYRYEINGAVNVAMPDLSANPDRHLADYAKTFKDYGCFKIGAAFSYHYQDIVAVHLWGDYFAWNKKAYDRPSWQLGLRVDGRIDRHWSLYSDNYFAGSRRAMLAFAEDETLKPKIDINLGCQYEWPELNLTLFAQLNNVICRHNDIFYGYQTIGINGLAGVTWRF